jgi:hypothetical protein
VATLAGSSEEQPALTRAPTIAMIASITLNIYLNLFILVRSPRGKNGGRPRRGVTDDLNPNADAKNLPSRLKGSSPLAAEPGERQKAPTLNVGTSGRSSSVTVTLTTANPRIHTARLASKADVRLLNIVRIDGDRCERPCLTLQADRRLSRRAKAVSSNFSDISSIVTYFEYRDQDIPIVPIPIPLM